MRRAIGVLLLTGLLLAWPLPALAGGSHSTGAAASRAALRADFNGDGAADLAVGAEGENDFAGVVHVLYGASPGGLSAAGSQLWSQDSPGIAGGAEPGDFFGLTLAAGSLSTGGAGAANPAAASPAEPSPTAPKRRP
jgi:FG-GAP repeat